MTDFCIKGTQLEKPTTNFEEWTWGEDDAGVINRIRVDTAEFVASEILSSMTIYMETGGDELGSIVWSTEAINESYYKFDLSEIVRGAIHIIETNYSPQHRQNHRPETIKHLTALKSSLEAHVALVESAMKRQEELSKEGR